MIISELGRFLLSKQRKSERQVAKETQNQELWKLHKKAIPLRKIKHRLMEGREEGGRKYARSITSTSYEMKEKRQNATFTNEMILRLPTKAWNKRWDTNVNGFFNERRG